MSTALAVPEIAIFPSDIPSGKEGKVLYSWRMKLHEEETLCSEDHGDEFDTVLEALDHAFSVFEDLVGRRHVYPSHQEQEFRLRITKA
jgi:hypothetical protein